MLFIALFINVLSGLLLEGVGHIQILEVEPEMVVLVFEVSKSATDIQTNFKSPGFNLILLKVAMLNNDDTFPVVTGQFTHS